MNEKKIVALGIDNIFPFYIDNVNNKFFNSLNQASNKKIVNKILPKIKKTLEEEELKKFTEIDNLTKLEKVNLMLNLALKKIVSKTGSYECDIFKIQNYDKFNEPMYIKSVEPEKDIEIISDVLSERRYNFAIEINSNSYLNMYLKKIKLSFYLDDENKILSGGFALQLIEEDKINFENKEFDYFKIIDSLYISNLIRHYISKQLYPISLNNILDIVSEYTINNVQKKHTSRNNKTTKNVKLLTPSLNFKGITANDLKDNWTELIYRKYLKFKIDFSNEQKKVFSDNLFFSILISTMIILSLYEELKIYFTSEKPELILNILDRPSSIKEDPNQNPEADFFELGKFLKQNYRSKNIISKNKYRKINKFEDLINLVSDYKATSEYESFGLTIPIYTIQIDDTTPFVSAKKIIIENMNMRILYLLTIYPELFGLNPYTSYFIDYEQLLKVIKKTETNLNVSESFKSKIENSRCEINNNYITYISDTSSILIIKKESVSLLSNYFWAEIYAQSRIWLRNDIEYDFNNNIIEKNSNFYREKIQILENLSFDWYDEFYGLSEIKGIVKKIDSINNLKSSIDLLIAKLKQEDSLKKKDTERRTMVIAFIVATVIGLINFFGMVFTILTVSDIQAGLTTPNIIVISIASVFAFILLFVVGYYLFAIHFKRKKTKKNKHYL